jgi:hypothetical protein
MSSALPFLPLRTVSRKRRRGEAPSAGDSEHRAAGGDRSPGASSTPCGAVARRGRRAAGLRAHSDRTTAPGNNVGRHGRRRAPASNLGSCRDRKGSNVGVELTSRAGLQPRARMPPKRQARRGVELAANDRNPRGRPLIARRVSFPLLSRDTPVEGREVLKWQRAGERAQAHGRQSRSWPQSERA